MVSTINPKLTLITIPDKMLWDEIISDPDLKSLMSELDPTSDNAKQIQTMMGYADDIDGDTWVGIDADAIYNNRVVNIEIIGYGYAIPISRGLFPKLRKAEYCGFSYRIFKEPEMVLALKKKWKAPSCTFQTIRTFKIL